jgi:TetR/AcrR family transcriptional regulator, transcriptional repressor of aconitase
MPRVSAGHLAARREQILTGARACFSRFGYEGATVRRLEHATGLSRGAIFHHFRDKESLFLELARQDAARMSRVVADQGLVQVMRELLADAAAGGSGVSWLGTRLEVSRRLRTDPVFRAEWRQHSEELTRAVQGRLTRQREAGVVRADVPVPVLTQYLELTFEGLVSHLAMGLPADDLRAVLDVVEQSLRVPTAALGSGGS